MKVLSALILASSVATLPNDGSVSAAQNVARPSVAEGLGRSGKIIADAQPPLGAADLISIATSVRLFRPKDAFDASPVRDLTGRRFLIDLPVRTGGSGGCVSMPYWRYSADKRELDLTFFGSLRLGGSMKDYRGKTHPVLSETGSYQAAPVTCTEVNTGSYRASNAFGATTTIARRSQRVVEIANAFDPLAPRQTDFMMKTVQMDPVEARAVTPRLHLRYEGTLHHWPTGTSVACGIEHHHADMTTVWEYTVDSCLFRGFVDHIAFVDEGTGKVIAERTFSPPNDHWL